MLVERKVGLFEMPAFWEDGTLVFQRPSSPFSAWPKGLTGTEEEAEQRKGGSSQAISWKLSVEEEKDA